MTGDFNHFEYKLCQTKPISKMTKMSITNYMIKDYVDNSRLLVMKKQSQTNPILTCQKGYQTQSKPNLSALVDVTIRKKRGIGVNIEKLNFTVSVVSAAK